jgi:hypothetical protein
MELFVEYILQNGKSDIMSIPEYPNPGQKDLLNNLNSVDSEWHTVNMTNFKCIIPSGKAPSNISKEQCQEIQERSTCFDKVDKKKVPIVWLMMEMRKLKIDKNFIMDRISDFESTVRHTDMSEEDTWVESVQRYNGFVQILMELHLYAKDQDGQPLPFCYEFYQKKEDKDNNNPFEDVDVDVDVDVGGDDDDCDNDDVCDDDDDQGDGDGE